MNLLVNDANILIDLLKVDLIEPFFRLKYEFHVTDFAAAEIQEENADQLERLIQKRNLIKWTFEFDELLRIQALKVKHSKLSVSDCSCLYLAERLSTTLLTGDAVLRDIAEQKRIPVHGLLWVFDELVKHHRISHEKAHQELEKLMTVNPRLPREECLNRLKRWNKGP
jgi:predicted nucleic acid-binding protein